jgi:adenylyltransferase/sulfurtransferase
VTHARFERQARFAPLGSQGQSRLEASSALIVGCGALGGSLALTLVRSGVGRVKLVDRDVIEESNLPRQVLFEPEDIARPKATVAKERLARVGGPTRIESSARHLDAELLRELADDVDLVLDGTDNLATRYLLNDYCVERGLPWIYGGVVGSSGLVLPVLPGSGACLRCLFPEPPPPGALPTCDTAGVLLSAVSAIAAFQSGAALRWLSGDGEARARFVPLCGRNTVQVRARRLQRERVDLAELAARLHRASVAAVLRDGILRLQLGTISVSVFPDGRALFEGTSDLDTARALYDRWLGS